MALTQADRIAISRKVVDIARQNEQADKIKAQLDEAKQKAIDEDNGNKALIADQTALIDPYQTELERYNGEGRTNLVEQDFLDSANHIKQNPFFPNDLTVPLPNVPDGVWKEFTPFSGNKAIGLQYNETFATIAEWEENIITDLNTLIGEMEAFTDVGRSTGQECVDNGSCSNPIYTDETACVNGGGIWTPNEVIQNDALIQAKHTEIVNKVQEWEDFLNATDALVVTTDTDPTRSAENVASKADIAAAIVEIDLWQAIQNFDTAHGQSTCAGFAGIDVNTLLQTKYRADGLQILKDEIAARSTFITTRISQIETNLGSVTQDFSTGEILAVDGFYGIRFRFVDLRLHLMNGSLNKVLSIDAGQDAQDELKQSNDSAIIAYAAVITVSKFRAPGAGTGVIHVLDASGFSVSDTVYVAADEQEELTGTISAINGNRVTLDFNVPKKYRQNKNARLYKVLT